MKDIKLICFFLLLSFALGAQIDSSFVEHASPGALKQMGKTALRQNDPNSAAFFYEAYMKKTAKVDAKSMNNLAQAYFQLRNYKKAQTMFLKAYNADKEKVPEALYYHAQMQKSNGLYDSAKINFQRFKKEYKGDNKTLKKQTAKEIVFCDSLQAIMRKDNKIIVQLLDTTINKVNAEGAAISTAEHEMVFTSLRTDKQEYIHEDYDTVKTKKKKLYKATRRGDVWRFSGEYGGSLNDEDFNTGNACFSPDRKKIYFTRCNPTQKGKMICAIYVSEKNGDTWTEPVKLPKEINDPKYTSTMPAVTTDRQKGEIIYFVSNRPNGKGGLDIWYSIYDKKKKLYKEAKNAGNKINTSQDEITPFFDNETHSFYFSSNGLGGLGGFDIFKGLGDVPRFSSVDNVGPPFNSGADDAYFTVSPFLPEEGFLVSNREGGVTLKNNSTCCDDIYYYKQTAYIKVRLNGKVNSDSGNIAVPNAMIEIYMKDKRTNEKIWVKTITTDSLGNYTTRIEADQSYILTVRKKGFLSNSGEMNTLNITSSTNLSKNLRITPKPKGAIFIPNIQYAFGKSELMPESRIIIDTTVLRFMQDNPELVIEISAHTDSKGSNKANLELSQSRAESVVAYLISRGIDPLQLAAKGYGESKPMAPNTKPDGSDNPDGRAKNRRTEFEIIGELDGVEIIRE
ncbi:MAG: OmpA family protein [Bacteroidetes bacterium]|nr:OmpA family protein [Bacteroidota bacterium]